MTEYGAERDDWPSLFERVMAADILVLLTPIWLGEKSSVATRVVERLYGEQELVLKTVDDTLTQSEVVAGASILGDGQVVLILDPYVTIRRATEEKGHAEETPRERCEMVTR